MNTILAILKSRSGFDYRYDEKKNQVIGTSVERHWTRCGDIPTEVHESTEEKTVIGFVNEGLRDIVGRGTTTLTLIEKMELEILMGDDTPWKVEMINNIKNNYVPEKLKSK